MKQETKWVEAVGICEFQIGLLVPSNAQINTEKLSCCLLRKDIFYFGYANLDLVKETVNKKNLFYVLLSKQKEILSWRSTGARPQFMQFKIPPFRKARKIAKRSDVFSTLELYKSQHKYYLNRLMKKWITVITTSGIFPDQ